MSDKKHNSGLPAHIEAAVIAYSDACKAHDASNAAYLAAIKGGESDPESAGERCNASYWAKTAAQVAMVRAVEAWAKTQDQEVCSG